MNGERKEKKNVQEVIDDMFNKNKEKKIPKKTEKQLFVIKGDKKKDKKKK